MFTATLFTIAKIWKQPKCPSTDEWIKKLWCVCVHRHTHMHTHTYTHTHNGILLSHKKEWNLPICNNMNGLGGHYANEVSQKEKAKYCMITLICGI